MTEEDRKWVNDVVARLIKIMHEKAERRLARQILERTPEPEGAE